MTIKEMREKQQQLVAEARAKLAELDNPENQAEARQKEIEAAHDAAMAEHDRLDARIARETELEKRETALAQIEDTSRRPTEDVRQASATPEAAEAAAKASAEAYRRAFRSFLRYGAANVTREERALLNARSGEARTFLGQGVATTGGGATGSDGGYLVPQGFMAELMIALKAYGPMLDEAVTRTLKTSTGNTIPWPTMDDTSNTGALISENTQVSLAEITFGTATLNAWKYTSGVVLVSSELLQDSALDVEAIVRAAMAERIGRIGNTHLTTGDGSSKPNGIVHAAGTTNAAAASALTFDDMIELFHSVDPAYRSDPSCKFMLHDQTVKVLRKLKDGQGRYIWQPANVATGQPATILDQSYLVNQAMDQVGATGTKPVVFGAFNRYVVRMVLQFAIRRLIERYADFDQTGFIGFTRFDGQLIDGRAVKALIAP